MGKSLSLTEFVALIAFLFSLIAIGTDMMLPALGIIAVDLKLQTENHAQLIITVFLLGTGLGQLISGPISDTYGRKIVLCTGISLFILASIAAIITSDFLMLLIARFIQGLGISAPRSAGTVSYTHLRAHETGRNLVCRLLLEKKNISSNYLFHTIIFFSKI